MKSKIQNSSESEKSTERCSIVDHWTIVEKHSIHLKPLAFDKLDVQFPIISTHKQTQSIHLKRAALPGE